MRIAAGPARPTRVRGGFRMIRAVLFDLDDTLFDHRHGARQALAAVRDGPRCAGPPRPGRLRAPPRRDPRSPPPARAGQGDRPGRGPPATLPYAARECRRVATPRRSIARRQPTVQRYIESWREVPGATALLRALAGRMRIGIVSNNLTREQHEKLRVLRLRHPGRRGGDLGGGRRRRSLIPRSSGSRSIASGTSAAETIMVGDAWRTDIAGARAAGDARDLVQSRRRAAARSVGRRRRDPFARCRRRGVRRDRRAGEQPRDAAEGGRACG